MGVTENSTQGNGNFAWQSDPRTAGICLQVRISSEPVVATGELLSPLHQHSSIQSGSPVRFAIPLRCHLHSVAHDGNSDFGSPDLVRRSSQNRRRRQFVRGSVAQQGGVVMGFMHASSD